MRIGFIYRAFENIGIELLSAMLKKAGHETKLFFEPNLFDDPFLSHRRLARFFDYSEQILADLAAYQPALVCFSLVTFDYAWACRLAQRVRQMLPQTAIVFGGIHVTSQPEKVLADAFADYVVSGEADYALVELAHALAAGQDPQTIANVGGPWGTVNPPRPLLKNLDDLPRADKHLYYREHRLFRIGYTINSRRGCPHFCSYCHNSTVISSSRLFSCQGSASSFNSCIFRIVIFSTSAKSFL